MSIRNSNHPKKNAPSSRAFVSVLRNGKEYSRVLWVLNDIVFRAIPFLNMPIFRPKYEHLTMVIDRISIECVHCLDARATIAVLPISDKTMAPSSVYIMLNQLEQENTHRLLYKEGATHSNRTKK